MNLKKWLAVYIYLEGSFEYYLSKRVLPLARKLKRQKYIDKYFFIRYSDIGPHIRLRFYGSSHNIERYVKPQLELWLNSLQIEDVIHYNILKYVYQDYEPEYSRYGEEQAMTIAETQFYSSSQTILKAITYKSEDYNSWAIGFALKMHLCFIMSTGLCRSEAEILLQDVFKSWLFSATQILKNIDNTSYLEKSETIIQAFENNYDKQKKNLGIGLDNFLSKIRNEDFKNIGWAKSWITTSKKTHKDLNKLLYQGKLFADWNFEVQESYKIIFIYGSYIHMTNNRLGILNIDEAFIAFLLLKLLDKVY
ncbi:hypothetical protein DVR12_03615 [Chitinophaga silvatica]|uniref:Thiopeptide-type bacteriocin biosynthesis domain-containing protein n=1 Tax=Chitinophaga silvatica TaxID=2282649 RepID=A0A3E1YHI0_9BACT|nr:thiopeptide-type bacteriocin biosynthesis protein [Chitinophaga silvatica]RFS26883.1 hypothetical protein DVR12_03615 [Chitinophaga silvatica]